MFILIASICHKEGFLVCFFVLWFGFGKKKTQRKLWEQALTNDTALQWEGTTNYFLFVAEVHSLNNSQSEAFANSRGVCMKDRLLSNYHHQPPNTVCKQVNNAKCSPEPAVRLHSLLKVFNLVKN